MLFPNTVVAHLVKGVFPLFILLGISFNCFSQEKELSWEEVGEHFESPVWYLGSLGSADGA